MKNKILNILIIVIACLVLVVCYIYHVGSNTDTIEKREAITESPRGYYHKEGELRGTEVHRKNTNLR